MKYAITFNSSGNVNTIIDCQTLPNWVNSGSYSCYSTCNKYSIEIDNNVNSLTYNTTRQGSLVETNSTFCGGCCGQSTTATWTNEGSAYCESCVSKQSQRDTNTCSATYNQTRVIDSGSACNTTQSWANSGSFDCYGTCNKYNVEVQNNPCAAGYNTTRQGSLVATNSTFCGGCCGQSTTATWTNEGSAYCESCVSKQSQRDTNTCSATYNQTRVIDSGSACNTTQSWANSGSFDCYGTCNKYNVEVQNNPCAAGYNTTRQGSLVATNSTFCGGCCGQSTTATWTNDTTACDGYTLYNVERDTNTCSATYNQTRRGSDIEYNSVQCGYVAPTPTPSQVPTNTKYNAILQQCNGSGQCIDNGTNVVIDSPIGLSPSTYYSEGGSSDTVYYVIGIAKSGTSTYTFINPMSVQSFYCCL